MSQCSNENCSSFNHKPQARSHFAVAKSGRCWWMQVRFAGDSPLEGDGLEPSVTVASEPVYITEGELRGDRRGSQKNWRGTDGSNPSPSSEESAANLNESVWDGGSGNC